MKLTKLDILNFIGARHVEIDADGMPLQLIAGANDSGKTSTMEGITLALTGQMARVKLKKDFDQLVTDGPAREGIVHVVFDVGEASFTVPKGVRGGWQDERAWVLPYVTYAHSFMAMEAKDRRALLFQLTGGAVAGSEVSKRLGEKDIPIPVIDAVMPIIRRSGFEVAEKDAARRATEAKGAWRAVTGKTWGVNAGAEFKADIPEFDSEAFETAREALLEARRMLEEAVGRQSACEAHANAVEAAKGRVEGLKASIARRAEIEAKQHELHIAVRKAEEALNKAKKEADAAAAAVDAFNNSHPTQPIPELVTRIRPVLEATRAGMPVKYRNQTDEWLADVAKLEPVALPQALEDAEIAASQAHEQALASLRAAEAAEEAAGLKELLLQIDADARALKAADAAMSHEAPAPVDPGLIQRLRDSVAGLETQVEESRGAAAKYQSAIATNEQAAKHHRDVMAWDACAKALSPNGIQAEILAGALDPVNEALDEVATLSGWPRAQINADMDVLVDGRPYGLWSESGQWRTDAALTYMIARLSGVRWFMLDRVDVLGMNNRPALIQWLTCALDEGLIDGATVMGTFAQKPSGLPDSWSVTWLEDGRVA